MARESNERMDKRRDGGGWKEGRDRVDRREEQGEKEGWKRGVRK